VGIEDGEDWLLRPVVEGLCQYESLKDGSVDLEDLARMNAALDVKFENERRARKAEE
jgi:hypothetical protein